MPFSREPPHRPLGVRAWTCALFFLLATVAIPLVGAPSWLVAATLGSAAFLWGYGLALARTSRVIAALARDVERDPLTGVCNRAALWRFAAAELALSRRSQRQLAVAFVDLDRFKEINDRFGHAVGDAVLVEVARRLCEQTRRSDLVCRFGGEEFVVLLRDTDLAAAVDYAERTRRLVAAQAVGHPQPGVQVTVSIGVAASQGEDHFDDLLRRADRAMYAAKAAGRNRIAVHTGDGVRLVPEALSLVWRDAEAGTDRPQSGD